MSTEENENRKAPATKLAFLEELRRIAQWGLSYTTDPYDIERYTRLLELAAVNYEELAGVPADVLTERFRGELGGNITPKVGVDAAIFDELGRILLIKRDDDQCWSVPGGWAELGESPQESIAREVLEETGLVVEVGEQIGLYHRMPGDYGQPHTSYHLLFHCTICGGEMTTTPEALEIGYRHPEEISTWHRDMEKVCAIAMDWRAHMGLRRSMRGWVVGVDGCKGGWCAVALGPDGLFEAATYPDMKTLWEDWRHAARILVDIPIGLPDAITGPRATDRAARRLIGARSASVFSVPCREAVYAPSYEEASACNRAALGKGLSKQAWNICPLIRDVESLLQSDAEARECIMESHPELALCGLNARRHLLHYKRTDEGFEERVAVLKKHRPDIEAVYSAIRETIPRKLAGRDDLLDALALAVAGQMNDVLCEVPDEVPLDGIGLPMRMMWWPVSET